MKDNIVNPHDRFFRHALADKRVAKEFFDRHLPNHIKELVNFDQMVFCKESFVDQELKLSVADVLYRADFQDQPGYLYLLAEHQSTVDPLIPFRLVKYMIRIMDFHLKQHNTKQLPLIYPMIFYHGSASYNASTDFFTLFGEQETLARELWTNPFPLIDVTQIADEELRQHLWSGTLEFISKHIFARDILTVLEQLKPQFVLLEKMAGGDYLVTLLQYVLNQAETKDVDQVIELVKQTFSENTGGKAMTIAEQLRARGYQEGIKEGRTIAEQLRARGYREGIAQGRTEGIEKGKTIAEQLRARGYQEGIKEGRTIAEQLRARGYREGMAKGIERQNRHIAMELLSRGMDKRTVAELTGLSVDTVEEL